MTILPTLKVEISFASPPLSAAPTFVDVSTDVRLYAGVTIRCGRADGYSQIPPSTVSFTLDNNSGTYTPDNTGSAYYPNVKRGRAVRITATEDGVTYYPRFYGFIDTLQVTWDSSTGMIASTQVTCVDLKALLAGAPLADNLVQQVIQPLSPLLDYWPLGDPADTVQPLNLGSAKQFLSLQNYGGLTTYGATFGEAIGPPYDGLTAVEVVNAQYGAKRSATTSFTPSISGIGVGGFYSFTPNDTAAGGSNDAFYLQDIASGSIVFGAATDSATGVAKAYMNEIGLPGGTINQFLSGVTNVTDGETHHIAVNYQAGGGGSLSLYVDGVLEASAAGIGASTSTGYGWFSIATPQGTALGGTVVAAHVVGFDSNVSGVTWAAIANAGLNGYSGETTAARAARIALYWAVSPVLIPTIIGTSGTQRMSPLTDITGKTILDLLEDTADTENGFLFVDRAGALTLTTRLALYNQTVARTLPADSYDPSLTFIHDRTGMANDVTATAAGSLYPQEVTDATSISDNGQISELKTLLTLDDNEALSYAQWRVGDGKAKTRSPEINIDLMTQQSSRPTLLTDFWQIDLGELIRLTGLPTAAPSSSMNLLVQGIEETWTDTSYDAQINTSAAPLGAWVLQDSTYGVLNSTTILAY